MALFLYSKQHVAAHHHAGQLPLVRPGGVHRADHFAVADYGDLIPHADKLAQLVGYEDDGEAVGDQLLQDGEEVLRLLRGQNGRRLVEDQDAHVPVEGLEDLHPLAYSHGEVGHTRPRVDLQAVALRELFRRPDGFLHVQGDA